MVVEAHQNHVAQLHANLSLAANINDDKSVIAMDPSPTQVKRQYALILSVGSAGHLT